MSSVLVADNELAWLDSKKEQKPAVTAAAKAQIPCEMACTPGHGFVLNGSFLWWTASENLSPYAQVVTEEHLIDAESGLGSPKGHLKSLSANWEPGFNIRMGWETDYDCWDLFSDWTWYRNTTHQKIHSAVDSVAGTNNGLGIYAAWLPSWWPAESNVVYEGMPIRLVLAGPFTQAKVHWNLSYDTFNIELGKSFKTRTNLLRPFFGVRGAVIERMAKATYSHYDNLGSLVAGDIDDLQLSLGEFDLEGFSSGFYKTKMNFFGIGPMLGIGDELRLPHGWRISGLFSAALYYGRTHGFDRFQLFGLNGSTPSLFAGSKYTEHNQWAPATQLQLRLGVDWATCFDSNSKEFLIGAAWEENVWFFHGFSADVSRGIMNLTLSGLTATAQFKF
jgi:hypothetical protein